MKALLSRFIIGAAVFLVGALLLIDTLNIMNSAAMLADWWPLFIVLAGIVIVINDTKNYLWALIVILFGVVMQLQVLDYTDIDPWQLLVPLVLIVVGVLIAFKHPTAFRQASDAGSDDIVAILGGADQRNTSKNFESGKVTAIMGGAKLDLRKATIKDSATIELFTLMGGIEIVVSRGVTIVNQTNSIMGGIENKTDQEDAKNGATLIITGDVIMGGVEIKN